MMSLEALKPRVISPKWGALARSAGFKTQPLYRVPSATPAFPIPSAATLNWTGGTMNAFDESFKPRDPEKACAASKKARQQPENLILNSRMKDTSREWV